MRYGCECSLPNKGERLVDNYLIFAVACQRHADCAKSVDAKASWLLLAEAWMRLVMWKHDRAAAFQSVAFEDAPNCRGDRIVTDSFPPAYHAESAGGCALN
jgi:hypothetical protein